tara:strand:- start:1649 stop:1963 length:315 start_codon:yes stop_codon:yes gene_type:complete
MDIIIYIFRLILLICVIHFITYQYNIDLFNLWSNNKNKPTYNNISPTDNNDNIIIDTQPIIEKTKDNELPRQQNIETELSTNNNDMEDNIKELQHSLKELEDYQ